MEWLVSSPPPVFNFDAVPQVVGGPYQYGVPGARHAVVFAPEEIGGGELTEVPQRTILVVANETIASRTLVQQIKHRAEEGYWRFTVAVATSSRDHRAAERRLSVALSVLAEAGVDASGLVVEGDPETAVKKVMLDEPVSELMVATYPTGRSRWMDHDLVDRLRKTTGLGVTRVVVTPQEAAEPMTAAGVLQLSVVANAAIGSDALLAALRERADLSAPGEGPSALKRWSGRVGPQSQVAIAVTLLAPLDLAGPGWTGDAEGQRGAAVDRVRATIDRLQADGIQAKGEVLDGDAADAARIAHTAHGAESVMVVPVRGVEDWDREETAESIRAAAGPVPVDLITLDAEAPAGA